MKGMISTAVAGLMAAPLLAQTTRVDFKNDHAGKPPAGWTATQTGSGRAVWTVEKDDTAPSKTSVLKQSGVATYPVCLKNDANVKDGAVEVRRIRTIITWPAQTPSKTTSRSTTRSTEDVLRRSGRT